MFSVATFTKAKCYPKSGAVFREGCLNPGRNAAAPLSGGNAPLSLRSGQAAAIGRVGPYFQQWLVPGMPACSNFNWLSMAQSHQIKPTSMKTLRIVFAFSLALLFSCAKEDIVNPNLLTGTWRIEQVVLNETDGEEINDWISNSTSLSIDDDKTYYRNYVVGKWSLNEKTLILDSGTDLKEFYWKYKILDLTDTSLIIQINLTERECCCDFEQFEEEEVLTITETYFRVE